MALASQKTERFSFGTSKIKSEYPDFLEVQIKSFQDFFQPVSYTHLDVYKRQGIGKVSFEQEQLIENDKELLATIVKLKPSSAKGTYVQSVFMSSPMSPGVRIDENSVK